MRYRNGITVKYELERGPHGGGIFTGEDCKIEINRNRFATNPADFVKDPPEPAKAEIWEGPGWIARPHIQNWIDCIKTREKPVPDVEIGHRSIAFCHLNNITRWMDRELTFDPQTERFIDADDDNDGVNDSGDGAPLDPLVCRDLDLGPDLAVDLHHILNVFLRQGRFFRLWPWRGQDLITIAQFPPQSMTGPTIFTVRITTRLLKTRSSVLHITFNGSASRVFHAATTTWPA